MIKTTLYTGANQCLTAGANCCVSFRDEDIGKNMDDFQQMFPDPSQENVQTWRVLTDGGEKLLAEGNFSDCLFDQWDEDESQTVRITLDYICHELLAHMLIADRVDEAVSVACGEGLEVEWIALDAENRWVVVVAFS